MSSKKNQYNDEIDMAELFIIMWKKKWNIITIMFLAFTSMLIFLTSQPEVKKSYKASTEIRPISTFDAFKYESYNSYIKNTTLGNVTYSTSQYDENLEKTTNRNAFIFKDIDLYANVDNSSFKRIDKEYLINLFIDKLNDNSIFIDAIKKFKLIKRENFDDSSAYENAVMKLSSSIRLIVPDEDNKRGTLVMLEFYTSDKETWEEILKYLEVNTNLEIKEYLNETFNKLVLNQQKIKKYKIEDIEILKSNVLDNKKYVADLNRLQKNLMENRNIERLQTAFESTPIITKKEFYAAKMMVQSTKYQNISGKSFSSGPMLTLALLIGGIIGIFYALIANAIQNRK